MTPERVRAVCAGLALTALVLAVVQAVAGGSQGTDPARAEVLAVLSETEPEAPDRAFAWARRKHRAPTRRKSLARPKPKPAQNKLAPNKQVRPKPVPAKPASVKPAPAKPAPVEPAPAAAERFVREYYDALDGRRFRVAWRMLAPGVQTAFGGFAAWREGYGRTLSQAPGPIRVTPAGAGATVSLTLRAGDNACGRTVERRFAVTWRLARMDAGWRATAASARKLGPQPC